MTMTSLKLSLDYSIDQSLTSEQMKADIRDMLDVFEVIANNAYKDLITDLLNDYREKRDSEKRLVAFCHTGQ